MSTPIVFISYSHDSEDHCQRVLELSQRLRTDGVETLLDRHVNGAPLEGWPRWMLNQMDRATHVLVVCTPTYYRRFRGHEDPGKGKGVDWEGLLITSDQYTKRSQSLKYVPVFLSTPDENCIPEPLRSTTHYALTTEATYQNLYNFLLGQAGVEPVPVGALKPRPRETGKSLTFTPAQAAPAVDISRITRYAPSEMVGREAETKVLSDAWDAAVAGDMARPRVLTFVAMGGEGKTSLVANWVAKLSQDWHGCEVAFAWSFYSQGTREQVAVSSDLFLKEALTFFGDPAMAGGSQGSYDKGRRLAHLVGERRALLILDGLEPLQYGPSWHRPGEINDPGVAVMIKDLAANSRGLCIVTTRPLHPRPARLSADHGPRAQALAPEQGRRGVPASQSRGRDRIPRGIRAPGRGCRRTCAHTANHGRLSQESLCWGHPMSRQGEVRKGGCQDPRRPRIPRHGCLREMDGGRK
jgi:hypothetical protein